VFSKYDVNGDRALDEAELRQMAADLEGQKVVTYNNNNNNNDRLTAFDLEQPG